MWRLLAPRLKHMLSGAPAPVIGGAMFVVTLIALNNLLPTGMLGQLNGGIGGINGSTCVPNTACCTSLGTFEPPGMACQDDGNICTSDTCDGAGNCVHAANPAMNGMPCDDTNGCTVNDVCNIGICSGSTINCDDGNVCTFDSCDMFTFACTHTNMCGPTSAASSGGSQGASQGGSSQGASQGGSSQGASQGGSSQGASQGGSQGGSSQGASQGGSQGGSSQGASQGGSSQAASSAGSQGSSGQASSASANSAGSTQSSPSSLPACIALSDIIIPNTCPSGSRCMDQLDCVKYGGRGSGASCPGSTVNSTTCCTVNMPLCPASSSTMPSRASSLVSAGSSASSRGASNASAWSNRSTSIGTCETLWYPTTKTYTPMDLASGPDGRIWYAQYSDAIGAITTQGAVTDFPLAAGKNPIFISNGFDGRSWFTMYNANAIGAITPGGTVTEYPLPTPGANPVGITMGPDGNVWFTESAGNKIGKITSDGIITEYLLRTQNAQPNAIITGPDGNIWFTEPQAKQIARFVPGGSMTEFATPNGERPYALVAGSDGRIWFAASAPNPFPNAIYAMSVSGQMQKIVEIPALFEMVLGIDNNIWYVDGKNHFIQLDITGAKTVYEVSDPTAALFRLTVGPDGNLWASDENRIKRIWKFCPSNKYIVSSSAASCPPPPSCPAPSRGCNWSMGTDANGCSICGTLLCGSSGSSQSGLNSSNASAASGSNDSRGSGSSQSGLNSSNASATSGASDSATSTDGTASSRIGVLSRSRSSEAPVETGFDFLNFGRQRCTSDENCSAGMCVNGMCQSCLNGAVECRTGYECDPMGKCVPMTQVLGESITREEYYTADVLGGASCGNRRIERGEGCDDGNAFSGDGCDASCQREFGAAPEVEGLDWYGRPIIGEGVTDQQYLAATIAPPPATPHTGPELVVFAAMGASAGLAFMRRRRKNVSA